MAKKVVLGPKPHQSQVTTADEWVNGSRERGVPLQNGTPSRIAPDATPMKRLTIDVSESLHAQIKSRCALKGVKMADEIRVLLEKHFV